MLSAKSFAYLLVFYAIFALAQHETNVLGDTSHATGSSRDAHQPSLSDDQVILISVDSLQKNHFNTMLNAGRLPNFSALIKDNGFNGQLKITRHSQTTTAPGHAEILTGFGENVNGVSDNSGNAIKNGLTIFEKLNAARKDVVLGSIWGKKNSYVPHELLGNARSEIDWWQDLTTWSYQRWIHGDPSNNSKQGYASSVSVAQKALEFLKQHQRNPFFLFIHFESPDDSGHYRGENSPEYDLALQDVDSALGNLMSELKELKIETETKVIITTDHGANEGGVGPSVHENADDDTRIIPLVTNDLSLVANATSNQLREQCEIAPTILEHFGVNIQDIENYGCESMRTNQKENDT